MLNTIMSDEELERLATEELLLEAGRGKQRSSTMGTYGWKKRQASTNKVFLKNTLRGVMSGNKHHSGSRVEKRHRGKDSLERRDSKIHVSMVETQKVGLEPYPHGRHRRTSGTSRERDSKIAGGSSRGDDHDRDFHSKESCSHGLSTSSSKRERKELGSGGNRKEVRKTGKHSLTNDKR